MAQSTKVKNLVEIVNCADWHDFKTRWRTVLSVAARSDRLYGKYIFRGQSCSSWGLQSSFDRKFSSLRGKEKKELYDTTLNAFAKNLIAFADRDATVLLGRPASVAEDMAEVEVLAQHHGLPTRLLDWSMSVYVAAFFAFSQVQICSTGLISIWALNYRFLTDEIDDDHLELHDNFFPKNSRQLWQLGVFVRNKTPMVDLSKIFEAPQDYVGSSALNGPPALFRFDIPANSIDTALDDLEMMRINSMSLFPGIEGVVRWLDRTA